MSFYFDPPTSLYDLYYPFLTRKRELGTVFLIMLVVCETLGVPETFSRGS